MKKIQSVLCAFALAISLSSIVVAGDIHTNRPSGDTQVTNGIQISEVFTWGDISGGIVSCFGILIGC